MSATLHLSERRTVWRSGDDEDETILSIRPFRLSHELTGILIDERQGFEHVKRWHALLAANGNKLVELWKGAEGAGPTYSTTAQVALPDGRQGLLFYSVFLNPDNTAPDKLRIEALTYESKTGKMIPYQAELNGLTVGPYDTVAAARQARALKRSCGPALWVLSASAAPGAPRAGYMLATLPHWSERCSPRISWSSPSRQAAADGPSRTSTISRQTAQERQMLALAKAITTSARL